MGQFRRQMQWNVKRSVAVASLFYFLYNGGKACLFPFLTLYFRDLGLSATQTGIICACKSLIWYFTAPVWIAVAKRIQKTRIVLCISLLAAIASNLSITLVPPYEEGIVPISCHQEFVIPTLAVENNSLQENKSGLYHSTDAVQKASLPPTILTTVIETTITTTQRLSTKTPTTSESSSTIFSTSKPVEPILLSDVQQCRIAANISERVVQDLSKSTQTITNLVSRYSLTTKLSVQNQQGIADKLGTLLEGLKSIHATVGKFDSSNLSQVASNLIKLLMPSFLEKKCLTPTLTATDFIKNTKLTSVLSANAKQVLVDALVQRVEEKFSVKPTVSTTAVTITTPEPSAKQLSIKLAPIIAKDLITTDKSITELLETYPETKNLPAWKRGLIATKIVSLLENLNEKESDSISKRSVEEPLSPEGSGDKKNLTSNLSTQPTEGNKSKISKTLNHLKENIYKKVSENAPTFLLVLFIVIAGEILASPIDLLSDDSLYELLDELDSLNRYGKHRMAGMFGVFLCGVLVSVAVFFTPCIINETMSRFHIHFYAFAALVGLAFALAPFYPAYSSHSPMNALKKLPCLICPSCSALTCTDCRHTLLLISVFIVGISQAAVQNFIFWQAQDLAGSSQIVYGCFVSAGALSSMMAALFGRKLMTIMKPFIVGPITMLFVSVQLVGFSFLLTPWMIVPLQFLSIFGQSLLWTLVSYQTNMTMSSSWKDDQGSLRRVNEIHVFARASQQRALYTAYVSTYQGISFAIGSVLSGVWYDLAGGTLNPVLRGYAALAGAWACLYMAYQCCCLPRRLHKKYSKLVADSEDEEEDEIYDASKNSWYTRTKSNYAMTRSNKNHKGNSGRRPKGGSQQQNGKQRRTYKAEYSSTSSEDEMDERDWLSAALKREDSRML